MDTGRSLSIHQPFLAMALPSGYVIRPAKGFAEKWIIYKLLILEREREPSPSRAIAILFHPYTFILFAFFSAILLFTIAQFWTGSGLYLLLIAVLIILGYFAVFHVACLLNLLLAKRKHCILALHRGKTIGLALLADHKKYAVLQALYIAPKHRGIGVGSCLVEFISQADKRSIYLHAPLDLYPFYARFGFVSTTRMQGYNMVRPFQEYLPKRL